MHWLARFLGWLFWLVTKWGILGVIAESTWGFFKSMADGLTVTQSMIWGLFALGGGLLFLTGVAYALDYLAGLLSEVLARRNVAKFFREMEIHGKHQAITLSAVVHFWNGGKNAETPMEVIQADFKLHHLKAAIGQGLLVAHGPGGLVVESTLCRPGDLAEFFGSWRWIWVDDSRWKSVTYQGDAT